MGLLDTMRLVEWKPMLDGRTRGLGITPRTTSDNLTPQETTNQDSPDKGPDGADLSCPGSSVVADEDTESTAG